MSRRRGRVCPHCGNRNPDFIESNLSPAERVRHREEETLLCVARVEPEDCSFGEDDAGEPGEDGLVDCGMQWEPYEVVS